MKEKGQEAGRYSSVRHKDTEEGKKRGLKKICKEESRREGYVLSRVKGRKSLCLYWVHTGNELASRSGTLRSTHWQCPCCGRPWSGADRQRALLLTLSQHTAPVLCVLGPSKPTSTKMKKGTHTPGPVQSWDEVPSLNEDTEDSRCTEHTESGGPQPPPQVRW